MYTTNVVVVTNFTENCTGDAKRAGGRLLPLLRDKTRHFFLEIVTYFLCVIFPNKYVAYYQSSEQELQIPSHNTAIRLMLSD